MQNVNLFLVYNTTHLLQVKEVIASFKLIEHKNILLVLGNKRHLYLSLRKAIDHSDWDEVIFIYRPYNFTFDSIRFLADKFKRPVKNAMVFYRYRKVLGEINKQYRPQYMVASNFTSNDYFNVKLIEKLRYRKLIHYDDGTASLKLREQIKFRSEQRKWYLGKVELPESMTFFSSYYIDDFVRKTDTVIRNQFLTYKSKIRSSSANFEKAYFIGSNIYAYYTTIDLYLDMLKRIKAFFVAKGVTSLTYIAHRNESEENLSKIDDILLVRKHEKIFENLLIEEDNDRPAFIGSFISSALSTSSIIFNQTEQLKFYAFSIDTGEKTVSPLIQAIYDDYQINRISNIQVIQDY